MSEANFISEAELKRTMTPSWKTYDGSYRKTGLTDGKHDYLVKWNKRGDLSVLTEAITSRAMANLGINAHEVSVSEIGGELVVVCKDFISRTEGRLTSLADFSQSSVDTDIESKAYTYDDVLRLIEAHQRVGSRDFQRIERQFWNMFIADAIFGNRDRHAGNWGLLETKHEVELAPLYDNSGSLFPSVNKVIGAYISEGTRASFLKQRTYEFPACMLRKGSPGHDKKTNYFEVLSDKGFNDGLNETLRNWRTVYRAESVFQQTWEAEKGLKEILRGKYGDVADWYLRFWVEMATIRHSCLILGKEFEGSYELAETLVREAGLGE